MGIAETICLRLARALARRRRPGGAGDNPASRDEAAYRDWRAAELRAQIEGDFDPARLAGRSVLDFGCGAGELSLLAAGYGAARVVGVDLDAAAIGKARAKPPPATGPRPEFRVAADSRTIPAEDGSVEVLLCFDVLEHVMEIESIVGEWARVLAPGGRVWIWWMPWWHPFGPHLESLVPIPWAHVLFSDRTLLRTCARIYDAPDYEPRVWDLDGAGRKKPNEWLGRTRLESVNRLTTHRFERLCRRAGLRIARRELHGFRAAPFTHWLLRLHRLREFLVARAVYEVRKP